VRKTIEVVLAILGCAIVSLVVGLVLAGLGASGVIDMQITHALFWLAFVIGVIAAPLATWLIIPSWKHCLAALVSTAVVFGGGLLWLDSWLLAKKAVQDAANLPPKSIYRTPPAPSIPITKTRLLPTPNPAKPQQDNSVHLEGGSKIEQQSSGPCSPNIIGGANSFNCGPPPPEIKWSVHEVIPPRMSDEKHEFKYEKQVMVTVNATYTPISLGVICDAEIEEVNVGMEGAYMRLNPRTGVDLDNRKHAYAYFEGTPATPEKPVWISLWSSNPFAVLEVRQAKINFH